MKKLTLYLDASSPRHFVGLAEGQQLLCWRSSGEDVELMEEVERLFAITGRQPAELSFIAVGMGPGSYTGIRMAHAIAQGMALVLGIPLVAIDPLRAYCDNKPFATLLDARVSGVYLWKEGMAESEACPIEELEQRFPVETTLYSPHIARLSKRLSDKNWVLKQQDPDPELLIEQGLKAFDIGHFVESTQEIRYLREVGIGV